MKGIGKKIILASKRGCRGFLLRGIVDDIFEFENMKEFKNSLIGIFKEGSIVR
jgi:hypothetical protein